MEARLQRYVFLCAAALGSVFFSASALAQTAGFSLDPQTGVTYGRGYDTTRKDYFKTCVDVDEDTPKNETGKADAESNVYQITSNSELVSKMNLSVDASFSALIGGGKLSLSSKNSLASDTNANSYNMTLLATAWSHFKPKTLKLEKVRLLPRYKKLLADGKKDQFKAECGDAFVDGVQQGREFYGTVTIDKQDLKSFSKFATDNNVNYESPSIQVNLDAKFEKSMENSFGRENIKINARSSGVEGIKNPTNLEQLRDIYENFNHMKGGNTDIKLHLVSYTALPDVEAQNPLDMDQIATQQGYLVSALWNLKAMQDDADFIMHNRNMFALGTTKATQNARFKDVKALRARWKNEFWALQKATKSCMANFTKQCEKLSNQYYSNRSTGLQRERGFLPDRYTSDCYSDYKLNMDKVFDVIFTDPPEPASQGYRVLRLGVHEFGDDDLAGGPLRTASWLRTKPDARLLKAKYEVVLEEWKMKDGKWYGKDDNWRTRFHVTSPEVKIFDLDNNDETGSLKQCTFTGIGVQNGQVAPAVYGAVANTFPVSDPKEMVAGYTAFWYSASPIPSQPVNLDKGAHGSLHSLRCLFDVPGGDDNKLFCLRPDPGETKLSLVNTLDQKADNWKPQKLSDFTVPDIK